MILYNSENNIRDIRLFCRMLSFVTAVLWSMSLNYQLLLKSPPLTLLAGSAPAFTHFCNDFFKKILYNLKFWQFWQFYSLQPQGPQDMASSYIKQSKTLA